MVCNFYLSVSHCAIFYSANRFLPERMTELMSASYMPFGLGNRMCIGNRLALIEMKMAMIGTLKAFTIEKNSETPVSALQY